MRPGLEKWFVEETAALHDKKIPYVIRLRKRQELIQAQEGVVKIYDDKSISPIDPVDEKDAREYLETAETNSHHSVKLPKQIAHQTSLMGQRKKSGNYPKDAVYMHPDSNGIVQYVPALDMHPISHYV